MTQETNETAERRGEGSDSSDVVRHDAPIKVCNYCGSEGAMPTFRDGETICYKCLSAYPEPSEIRAVFFRMKEALNQIREYNGMIPLHTEDAHVFHCHEQIEAWCSKALDA